MTTARRLVRFVTWAGWVGCLASVGLAIAAPELTRLPAVQWSPWLLGLFVLGIPHGAFDHRVGGELAAIAGDRPVWAASRQFYLGYLAAAATVLTLWFVSPQLASASFLAMAAVHFGQGDVYWSWRFGLAGRTDSLGYRVVLLLVRSALPIAIPLVAYPAEFASAADVLATRLFGRSGWSVPPSAIATGWITLTAIVALQLAWAAWLARGSDPATRWAAAIDGIETLILVALFGLVPPVLALGIYFNVWHSLRHVARLLLIARSTRDLAASGRLVDAFAVFGKGALPMTLGALAMVLGLGLIVGRSLVSVSDLGLVALVGLSMLTLPHVLVVAWMDARQGIWTPHLHQG